MQLVLFKPYTGPYQVLPLRTEWAWEQWQRRGVPHSPKLQHHWNLRIRLFSVISRSLVGGWSYPSAEVQSVYSIVPADREILNFRIYIYIYIYIYMWYYIYLCMCVCVRVCVCVCVCVCVGVCVLIYIRFSAFILMIQICRVITERCVSCKNVHCVKAILLFWAIFPSNKLRAT